VPALATGGPLAAGRQESRPARQRATSGLGERMRAQRAPPTPALDVFKDRA
jgi:hypothetical protein